MELLDNILENRYWIIETLGKDNFTNNPYAKVNIVDNSKTQRAEVLESYQEHEAFKFVVNALDVYDNPGDYVSDITDSILTGLMSLFSCDTEEGVFATLDDLIASKDELRYESVFNAVLQTDFSTSWGETYFSQSMRLEELRQQTAILNKLNTYRSALQDAVGVNGAESSSIIVYSPCAAKRTDYEVDVRDYAGHVLSAYEQDLEKALTSNINLPLLSDNEALEKKVYAASAMGMAATYQAVTWPDSPIMDEVFFDGMFDGTMKVFKGTGKTLSFATKSINVAIIMEALQSQKDTTVKTMGRLENYTDDEDLQKVLVNMAQLIEKQGDEQTLNYEAIANYIRNNKVITNFVMETTKKTAPKLLKMGAEIIGGAKGVSLTSAICRGITKSLAIIDIASWVANEVVGIKDTAKKIHILKYVDRIIAEAEGVLFLDLAIYKNNKTEENAKNVLDDLELLKMLKCYGEKTALESYATQYESWIGILLGGNDTLANQKKHTQGMYDTYLGCTASPISTTPFTLSEGDRMLIMNADGSGSDWGVYATVFKKGGGSYRFPEADYRLYGGVVMNGGTLELASGEGYGIYLPLVTSSSGVNKITTQGKAMIGCLENNAQLAVSYDGLYSDIEIVDKLINTSVLNLTDTGSTSSIKVQELENSSSIAMINSSIDLVSTGTNDGYIDGVVNICGGEPYFENAYFKIDRQALMGSGTYTDLRFSSKAKKGVEVEGDLKVNKNISNPSTRIVSTDDIVLVNSCTIANNYFNGNLGFRDYTSNQSFTLDGSAYAHKNVTFGGNVTLNDSLYLPSDCSTLTLNGDTLAKGDLLYKAGTIAGSGQLKIKGDVNITTISPTISYLNFVGGTAQEFNSENPLTVSKLNNSNTSLGGVTFNQKIYVTDKLYSERYSAYGNGKNVILKGTAKLDGNTINGNISAENWSCVDSVDIKKNFYTSGDISIAEGKTVDVKNFYNTSGTLTLAENSAINCSGEYSSKGTVTNAGTISIKDDALISGAFNGGTLKVKGDVSASAELTPDNLVFESKLSQYFKNTSSTSVQNLTVNNTSSSGLTVDSIIYVNNCFNDNSVKINNGENIILNSGAVYLNANTTQTDLCLASDFTVTSGETITVNGDLILKSGANLIVEDGGKVVIKKSLKTTSSQINVSEGGIVQVNDYFKSSSDTLNISGDFIITGDCKMSSSTINADGLVTFKGDLETSSCTWNNPNISFMSKLQQTVSGSTINANNLTVNNGSKNGFVLKSTINYYGTYEKGDSVITGESYIVEKE
jgi:hypothetical protein